MNVIGNMITGFFNLIVMPFGGTNHTLALIVLSGLTGVGMAFVFKWVSDDRAVRTAKDRLKARILEMRIYQDDPLLIIRGFGGTLRSNLGYLAAVARPMIVLLIPLIIVWMQMDERYSHGPLDKGSTTLLQVEMREGINPFDNDITIATDDGLIEDANPVRIAEPAAVAWRLRVEEPGTHQVTLSADGESYAFPVTAEKKYRMIGRKRGTSWIEPMLHPAMPAIPTGSPFAKIELAYPSAGYTLFFWNVPWWAIFLFYLSLAAIALKLIIKFEI